MEIFDFICGCLALLFLILLIISILRGSIFLFILALVADFIIAIIIYALYPLTAQYKAEQIAKENAIKLGEEIKKKFQQLSEDPNNTEAFEFLLSTLASLNPPSFIEFIFIVTLPLLQLKPLDERVRTMVFSGFARSVKRDTNSSPPPGDLARSFYDTALGILALHPEELSLKQYVLDVGRWYYSILRPDGRITVYDEQAIQNDIIVRTK